MGWLLFVLVACAPLAPSATPQPAATAPVPSPTLTLAPTMTVTQTPAPTFEQPPTSTAISTATLLPTATPTPLPTPTQTPTARPSPSPTIALTRAPTLTPLPTETARPTAAAESTLRVGQTLARGGVTMVAVPAGEFLWGSSADPFAAGNEQPQRKIYLDAFWFDQYEVTNEHYARCVTVGVCRKPAQARSNTRPLYYGNAEFAAYPVIYVAWLDAKNFCAWSGKRLPTEAEWEKAARSADGRRYPWGDEFDASRLNAAESGNNDTLPVSSYPNGASVYGAHNLAGNVWEWVADFYQADYYRIAAAFNPTGPASGPPPAAATGIMRGGAWNNNARAVRSTYRLGYFQRHVGFEAGMRCAWGG